jgi:hypothetical protein
MHAHAHAHAHAHVHAYVHVCMHIACAFHELHHETHTHAHTPIMRETTPSTLPALSFQTRRAHEFCRIKAAQRSSASGPPRSCAAPGSAWSPPLGRAAESTHSRRRAPPFSSALRTDPGHAPSMHSSGGTSATFWGLGSFPDRRRPRRPPPLPSTLPPPPLDAPALAATAALAAASAALAAALALTAAAQRAALHPAALHRCVGWRERWSPTRGATECHHATRVALCDDARPSTRPPFAAALAAATSAAASLTGAALAASRSSACPRRNEKPDTGSRSGQPHRPAAIRPQRACIQGHISHR